jgi:phosphoribosyl 1,2-cyclic phosphodiesterase
VLFVKVEVGKTKAQAILIDAGCSGKRVRGFIAQAEYLLKVAISVEAIVLSHWHSDHASCLHILANTLGVKRVIVPNIFDCVDEAHFSNTKKLQHHAYDSLSKIDRDIRQVFYLGGGSTEFCGQGLLKQNGIVKFLPVGQTTTSERLLIPECQASCSVIKLAHDTLCFGLSLEWADMVLAYVVDLGQWSNDLVHFCSNSNSLILEMNYDEQLIHSDKVDYPVEVRDRIVGKFGHLSNKQACQFLHALLESGTCLQAVLAAHRGGQSNQELLVQSSLDLVLKDQRVASALLARQLGTLIHLESVDTKIGVRLKLLTKILQIP